MYVALSLYDISCVVYIRTSHTVVALSLACARAHTHTHIHTTQHTHNTHAHTYTDTHTSFQTTVKHDQSSLSPCCGYHVSDLDSAHTHTHLLFGRCCRGDCDLILLNVAPFTVDPLKKPLLFVV